MNLTDALKSALAENLAADKACAALMAACNPANGHGRLLVPGMSGPRKVEDFDAWRVLAQGVGITLNNLRLLLAVQAQVIESFQKGFVLTDEEAGRVAHLVADLVAARLGKGTGEGEYGKAENVT